MITSHIEMYLSCSNIYHSKSNCLNIVGVMVQLVTPKMEFINIWKQMIREALLLCVFIAVTITHCNVMLGGRTSMFTWHCEHLW